jgi:hypothetical protein
MLGWAFHLGGRKLEEMTLDHAIATLYAREINCGCETFWDGGMKVWIGDIMNGHHSETMFSGGTWATRDSGSSTRRREFFQRRFSSGVLIRSTARLQAVQASMLARPSHLAASAGVRRRPAV